VTASSAGCRPARSLFDPYTGEVLVQANEENHEDKVRHRQRTPHRPRKGIRSVLTCEYSAGDLRPVLRRAILVAWAHMVNIGEAVGVIAASPLVSEDTQLTIAYLPLSAASAKCERSNHSSRRATAAWSSWRTWS